VLACIPSAQVQDTEAGCCGMAGSFGYEVEHASGLKTIAELSLLARLLNVDSRTKVVSNEFSCRHQIADLSGHKSQHIAEVVRSYI
jgi:Fe-S oxidoreductase